MKNKSLITILISLVTVLTAVATISGVVSNKESVNKSFISIHNQNIALYGKGIYRNMSSDVAVQGIAQDYVTLMIGIPLILIALIWARKNTLKAKLFLAGILQYFFLTYLFYMNMAMYNELFLVYIFITSLSFFSLILIVLNIDILSIPHYVNHRAPVKWLAGFQMFMAVTISLLWLSIVAPPLMDGSIVPKSVEHYTTLTVQAFDLSIFLPIAFVSGLLLFRKQPFGYFMSAITLVFLSVLMSALVAKVIAMGITGQNIIPAIFIIPSFLICSVICTVILFNNIKKHA